MAPDGFCVYVCMSVCRLNKMTFLLVAVDVVDVVETYSIEVYTTDTKENEQAYRAN